MRAMTYKTCELCNCNLDPGERCDCEENDESGNWKVGRNEVDEDD
jgi:hypothetical protein